ncbi:MAG: SPFH domain-containing protein [Planctomycetota bacterium]|jgi:uncharacterized membrane protein YqiK
MLAVTGLTTAGTVVVIAVGGVAATAAILWLLGLRYIPHNRVGIVEKLWSLKGSLKEGRIIALDGEAGYQSDILRGGLHFLHFPWQYRIRKEPLVTISEGKIGYVYARDGKPLTPTQTLGKIVASNDFQDARVYLRNGGQRGRQRAILREGVYAVNLAQFVVITETAVFAGPIRDKMEERRYGAWQNELGTAGGFSPVVIGHGGRQAAELPETEKAGRLGSGETDTIGIVTVHDGPPIASGEIIASEVKPAQGDDRRPHDYFQDPEAFLALGGNRGKQLQVLTDGTFFINRWFATVEIRQKTLIPIGYVGVVVSYHGVAGEDVTGDMFRYGEQVESGHRGVWKRSLPPGKYPLNPYALKVELVPTVNFVLRWVTGMVEAHKYDKDLKSIEIITADGYEPMLPLSLVLHIDYEKAPRVVQRFGDVTRLISQTLDPILSAYFRDVAQNTHMLDLLTKREDIQRRATEELGRRFQEYDINCISVLIGRPESKGDQYQPGEDPIERLFDQLRFRRLAKEQVETYAQQEAAAKKLKDLKDAQAAAEKQAQLTQTKIEIEISGNSGEAELAKAQRLAKRDVARAEGESRAKELLGKGEASRIAQTGLSEAAVFLKKISAYGDPRLFALSGVARELAQSQQPLVPERLLAMGGGAEGGDGRDVSAGLFGRLIALLLADKAGLDLNADTEDLKELRRQADEIEQKVQEAGQHGEVAASARGPAAGSRERSGGASDQDVSTQAASTECAAEESGGRRRPDSGETVGL